MTLTAKQWVQQHSLYVEVAAERDALALHVAELRAAITGAELASRVTRSIVDGELEELREENEALKQQLAKAETESLKVVALG